MSRLFGKISRMIQKILLVTIINIMVVIVLFLVIEGYASCKVVYKRIKSAGDLAERRHTQYDEEIGWLNLPNIHIEDLYGDGRYLTTNSQMFRNDKDFTASIPSGKVRIICSGDSHTLGHGVSNENTWCEKLTTINNRIESVNMGQGGYGIDQAYLWYMRNSNKMDHDIHIFAFITADFMRMKTDDFRGYGKPLLKLQDGTLVNKNRPVPKRSYLIPKLAIIKTQLRQLNSVQLLRKRFSPTRSGNIGDKHYDDVKRVSLKIYENLYQVNQLKNSILVLVYLPTPSDHAAKTSDPWRQLINNEATRNGWIFIDLIEEFRKYPAEQIYKLFRGHLNELGNAYVADIMYKKLMTIPEITDKFEKM
jgi:hypothetical protein